MNECIIVDITKPKKLKGKQYEGFILSDSHDKFKGII
jgi:hypothetical protein